MAKLVKVLAPNPAFRGDVASVHFDEGEALVDPGRPDWVALLGYFQSAGYTVDGVRLNAPFTSTPVSGEEGSEATEVRVGSPAQDALDLAGNDESDEDETEEGAGDSPASEPAESDQDETADEADPSADVVQPERPANGAPVAAWRDWAVASGADPIDAATATKSDLIAKYGG